MHAQDDAAAQEGDSGSARKRRRLRYNNARDAAEKAKQSAATQCAIAGDSQLSPGSAPDLLQVHNERGQMRQAPAVSACMHCAPLPPCKYTVMPPILWYGFGICEVSEHALSGAGSVGPGAAGSLERLRMPDSHPDSPEQLQHYGISCMASTTRTSCWSLGSMGWQPGYCSRNTERSIHDSRWVLLMMFLACPTCFQRCWCTHHSLLPTMQRCLSCLQG